MATTAQKALNGTLSGGWIGNSPYVKCQYGTIYCTVDYDANRPFAVKCDLDQKVSLKSVGGFRGSDAGYWCNSLNGDSMSSMGGQIQWGLKNGSAIGSKSSDSGWVRKTGYIVDVRRILGNNFASHTWYEVTASWHYWYTGYAYIPLSGWDIVSASSNTYTTKVKIYTPRVCGGPSSKWQGSASRNSSYAYRNVYVSASYSGLIQGNESHTVTFKVGGKTIGSQTNRTSGTIGGYFYANYIGNVNWSIECSGKTIRSGTWYFQDPPPAPPTMGGVNNTTASSINTIRTKTLSANWGVSNQGWPITTITYEYHCYSTTYGELASGTTTGGSHSFTWNMPRQDVRDNIYWKVRAKNSTGWSSYVQSGNVEVYWAYTEPARIAAGSVTPNRFQLFNGNTNISYNANTTIGSWGDRPGTRSVEYGLYRNGTNIIKWYGRLGTSSTGTFSQSLSATVPETDLNNKYYVIAHKRIGDTEYTTSSDARFPTTGQNHVTAGIISFYEVIGKIEGAFSLDPGIIISGLPNDIKYSFTYDKQSSEKVDIFIEVYRIPTGKVTKTVHLNQGLNVSKTFSGTVSNSLVEAQQADAYEIRYKATVTELLGNTHTYTLATLTPQVYNPPIGGVSIQNISLPLPTYNATSYLAKQATDITWNYTYSFQGVQINKVVLVINSEPFGREEIEVPFNATTSPYYNSWTRKSTGDFKLGSQVDCKMIIYYQIVGGTRQYSVTTDTLTIDITPTRYLYYLARTEHGEQQLNKIHPLVNGKDKISEKIHID